jgi:hypothetical protein
VVVSGLKVVEGGAALPFGKLPDLDDIDAQIQVDHREGKEQIAMTRATARALYYALYDTLYRVAGREHDPHDVLRLGRAMTRFASIGWPP